jgi:lipopolysaccharide biosynthesis protein
MRRVIFYLFYDPQGRVDDYVLHKLTALRHHAEHIFVVSNSVLEPDSRARLETVADTVWERENIGFDVWGYKEALEQFGPDRLATYDELIMMNYTFFGPITSFDPLFDRYDNTPEIDFWGITNHGEVIPHPFTDAPRMPMHIQSHWIAVRKSLFTSTDFTNYWATMPMITSYNNSIDAHESKFTEHFSTLGYTFDVAYPETDYPSVHPIFDNATSLLRDDCPIVKRRTFFHDPLYLDRNAIIGRDIDAIIAAKGFPMELIYSNVARTSKPRVLATNFSLLEILPEHDLGYDTTAPLSIVAVAHIYYEEMTDEILDRLDTLPHPYDLVITTTDDTKKTAIQHVLDRRGTTGDIRVVESNRGRAESAFFIGCRDVINNDKYDLIVKIHSKKSPQVGQAVGGLFKRHLFENLLNSPAYTANVLRLFQQHSSLGMVFPPIIHMGHPTLGHAWFSNRENAEKEAKRLGITVPFDDSTPIAPYGTMFIARPQALRRIANAGYQYTDFPDGPDWHDGMLAHVLERLMGYAALTDGYHIRQTLTINFAQIYYTFLEYKLQAVSAYLPGYPIDQLWALQNRGNDEPTLAIIKTRLIQRNPRVAALLRPFYRSGRRVYRLLKPAKARSTD